MNSKKITPVILCGGSGTRLWPLSRERTPKQMLKLLGERTMLQMTAARVSGPDRFAPPIVVAKESHADDIDAQFADIGCRIGHLVLEPSARNTAAAIALAALVADDNDLLLVLPSDHLIADSAAFLAAVGDAATLAEQDWIVTFGIRPAYPETGYGYIRRGEGLGAGAFRAEAFMEKPDLATASAYVADGRYDWNGGIFLFRAGAMREALEKFASDILSQVRAALDGAVTAGNRIKPDTEAFAVVRKDSIDYAVMERADKIAVVPVDIGWSDIGSWDAIFDLVDKDERGNHLSGDALAIDSDGCMIRAEKRLVVAAGVKDLVIIETGDAILILPRGQTQLTKNAVEALKKRDHPALERSDQDRAS